MKDIMSAAVFHGVSEGIKIEEIPVPHLEKEDDILIQVKSCGICGTDLSILDGIDIWISSNKTITIPVVLGHEAAGKIVEIGDRVTEFNIGDHVVVDVGIACGSCENCRSLKMKLCKNIYSLGADRNGAFAEYLLVPKQSVHKIPKEMSWDIAFLAEPLACIVNGLQKSRLQSGENVAVFGAGPMGMLMINLLRGTGAGKIISVELNENRRNLAKLMGADYIINPDEKDPVDEISKITGGGSDISIELTGNITATNQAIHSTGYSGRTIIIGETFSDAQASFSPFEILRYQKEILGVFGDDQTFIQAIKILQSGIINTDKIVSHKLSLNDINRGFDMARKRQCIKTVIIPV